MAPSAICSTSGAISGTPTESGDFAVTVTVSDSAEGQVEDEFNIAVSPILNADDYAALQALYDRNGGKNWTNNTNWDVSSETPPDANDVDQWHVVDSRVTKIELSTSIKVVASEEILATLSGIDPEVITADDFV